MSPWYTTQLTSITIWVKAKPGVRRLRLPKLVDIGEGKRGVEISVSAQPEAGKANQAIIKELATFFDVSRSDIVLKSGATSRLKCFVIKGNVSLLKTFLDRISVS